MTGSIERALNETSRRREIQRKFNKANKITPKTATSKIKDVMEGARSLKKKKIKLMLILICMMCQKLITITLAKK